MQTIEQVEQQIKNNTELLEATKQRIKETTAKLTEAQGNVKNMQAKIIVLKKERQTALARGGDVKSLNDALKKLESEFELESETVAGLQKFLAELQQEEQSLHLKLNELPKRILQLRSLELAASYNSLAGQLAPVVEELNRIWFQLTGNGNRQADMVVFYPKDKGPFVELPKIFFDDECLNLEGYVAKFSGRYHSNTTLPESEKNFYNWAVHENKLKS